jgi:hypothetical protein
VHAPARLVPIYPCSSVPAMGVALGGRGTGWGAFVGFEEEIAEGSGEDGSDFLWVEARDHGLFDL